MGCDIHMYVEIKQRYPNPEYNAPWEAVGNVFKYPYYNEKMVPTLRWYDDDTKPDESNSAFTNQPYVDRNYSLFAILGDVRNGRGFAGVKTGEGFNPIASNRGVPDDASDYYKHIVADWDADGHSHSYLSMEELENYDWEQQTILQGVVHQEGFRQWLDDGEPKYYSGAIWGPNIETVSNREMRERLDEPNDRLITSVSWVQTYASCCEEFLTETMPQLRSLRNRESVLDMRIVFFFDN